MRKKYNNTRTKENKRRTRRTRIIPNKPEDEN